jgi:hypothetical protein
MVEGGQELEWISDGYLRRNTGGITIHLIWYS